MKLTHALIGAVIAVAGAPGAPASASAAQQNPIAAPSVGAVSVLAHSLYVRDGLASVGLLCRGASCAGSLELQGRATSPGLYGKLNFSLAGEAQTVLTLRLTSAGAQLLSAAPRVQVWATLTLRGVRTPPARLQLTLIRVLTIANRWHRGFNKFWSGYAVTGQRFRAVRGTFIQPSMSSCSGSSAGSPDAPIANNVSIWSGLDGLGSSSIEQVGTEVACVISSGSPPTIAYYAWYETFPDKLIGLPLTVHPGDTISTEVKEVNAQHFAMTLEDRTTAARWTQVVYQHAPALRISAEWIDETQGVAMPNISTTSWSSISTTARGTTAPIGQGPNFDVTALTTSNPFSKLQIQPSPLSPAGDSFSVSWLPTASR